MVGIIVFSYPPNIFTFKKKNYIFSFFYYQITHNQSLSRRTTSGDGMKRVAVIDVAESTFPAGDKKPGLGQLSRQGDRRIGLSRPKVLFAPLLKGVANYSYGFSK